MKKTRREIQVTTELEKIINSIRIAYNIETDSGAIVKALTLYKSVLLPLVNDFSSLQESHLTLKHEYSKQKSYIKDFASIISSFFLISKTKIPK